MNWERKHENVNEERQNRWIKNIPHNELMLVERHTEQRKKCMMELECKTTSENIYVSLKYLCLTAKKKNKKRKKHRFNLFWRHHHVFIFSHRSSSSRILFSHRPLTFNTPKAKNSISSGLFLCFFPIESYATKFES